MKLMETVRTNILYYFDLCYGQRIRYDVSRTKMNHILDSKIEIYKKISLIFIFLFKYINVIYVV